MIPDGRIRFLNNNHVAKGRYVLYWMQQSQRAECNHALEYAAYRANESGLPLVTYFGLTANFPEAHERHYRFMLEGLAETARVLERRGIRFVLRIGEPDEVAVEMAGDAALAVTDRGYLRVQKAVAGARGGAGCGVRSSRSRAMSSCRWRRRRRRRSSPPGPSARK